jgi:hypothetical protein
MRSASLVRDILLTVLVAVAARAAEPPAPQPQGYVVTRRRHLTGRAVG